MTKFQCREQTADVEPENEAQYEAAGWSRVEPEKPAKAEKSEKDEK